MAATRFAPPPPLAVFFVVVVVVFLVVVLVVDGVLVPALTVPEDFELLELFVELVLLVELLLVDLFEEPFMLALVTGSTLYPA